MIILCNVILLEGAGRRHLAGACRRVLGEADCEEC